MDAPPSRPGVERADESTVRIGALVPLARPGWVEAGRHLLAGLELAAGEVNDAGGIRGRPLELVIRDTAADPQRATAAVDELARLGVAAVAGEYHSVVARAAAARADALGLPFLCSSAVLDALTEEPTEWVARLAPAQAKERRWPPCERDHHPLAPSRTRRRSAWRRLLRQARGVPARSPAAGRHWAQPSVEADGRAWHAAV